MLRRPFESGQYAALAYRKLLAHHKLAGSMGRRGNPYDNAKAESFMKTLKVEAVSPMAYETFEDVTADLPHRSRLQCSPAALSSRVPQSHPLRGSTRPGPGQNRSMTLSTNRGALHSLGPFCCVLPQAHSLDLGH